MVDVANILLLLVILLNFFVLGSNRLGACIRTVALQGGMLALVPIFLHPISGHLLLLAGTAMVLKVFFMPWLLFRAIRMVKIRREIEPMIGYVPTLILGTLATASAFIFSDRLPLIEIHQGSLAIPCSLATLATGFLMLIARRKALTQALGYLILENGIYVFGVLLAEAMPFMVEAGVLLDLLVAIFIMGIMVNQISRTFSSLNMQNLSSLRE
ncbi:MAG: hydrogenase [Deltaproteobacteria bacterium CG23_combo_of_CG06-09_8_20_14_all_60_8]|nr:MAG: hydrogenase [Deltaproteobacteria bacterium CG23_combo_of_CG06-09_8_20_14_all_60_8]